MAARWLFTIIAVFASTIVSTFIVTILNPKTSMMHQSFALYSITIIINATTFVGIWTKGLISGSERFSNCVVYSIVGIAVFMLLDFLTAILFGYSIGALSVSAGLIAGTVLCRISLKRASLKNENSTNMNSRPTVTGNCPLCGSQYTNLDYSDDAQQWYCSSCKAQIPRLLS